MLAVRRIKRRTAFLLLRLEAFRCSLGTQIPDTSGQEYIGLQSKEQGLTGLPGHGAQLLEGSKTPLMSVLPEPGLLV